MNQREIESDLRALATDWTVDEAFGESVSDRISLVSSPRQTTSRVSVPRRPYGWSRSAIAVSLALLVGLVVVPGVFDQWAGESFVAAEQLSWAVRRANETIESARVQTTSFDDDEKPIREAEFLLDRQQGVVRGSFVDGVWTISGLDNGEFEWSCDFEAGVVRRWSSTKEFARYFEQTTPSEADYERLESEDIYRGGQKLACYGMKNLAPFSDGAQRSWIFIDRSNLVQESRTWKFKNERWNLVQTHVCDYNVTIDPARFEPRFDDQLELVDVEQEVNAIASLENCLFSTQIEGLTYAVHRATPVEGGGLAVFASLRETSPESASHLMMWSFDQGSWQAGDFFRITNAEAVDRVRMQWFVLAPRKPSWKVWDGNEGVVDVDAETSIVDGDRVRFADALWLTGPDANIKPDSRVDIRFECELLPSPVSLREAALLVLKEQQQLPHVTFRQLHMGVKSVGGTPTEQRASIENISTADFQQAVVDYLAWCHSQDHESEANVMEYQIKRGFVSVRVPAVNVEGIAGFGDSQLARACQRENLVQVDVSATAVTDAGLESLLNLKGIERLILRKTAITDRSIPVLVQLTSLAELDIRETQISAGGARKLQDSLGRTEVLFESVQQ